METLQLPDRWNKKGKVVFFQIFQMFRVSWPWITPFEIPAYSWIRILPTAAYATISTFFYRRSEYLTILNRERTCLLPASVIKNGWPIKIPHKEWVTKIWCQVFVFCFVSFYPRLDLYVKSESYICAQASELFTPFCFMCFFFLLSNISLYLRVCLSWSLSVRHAI